ncbi:MAG TPA: hypothetical protein DCL77_11965 [Prolixibacteraceae bacterium]|jgi:hypothetical protein|nr:hypothetical protein [Prolixibacteraceae bacterium]
MITVKMTEQEYKAYLLYLKSIEILLKAEKDPSNGFTLDKYLEDPENIKEIEAGIEDIKAGRITYIDPNNIWESIK